MIIVDCIDEHRLFNSSFKKLSFAVMPFSTHLLKFVFKPLKLKSNPSTLGTVNLNLFGLPIKEFLSISGPAGYSRPIILPHLSNASPIESSKVSPIRSILK